MGPSLLNASATLPAAELPEGSCGAHIHALLAAHTRRLVKLHPSVLDDHDPEPLHQMRVAMRRLRTCLVQFEPALVLPERVSARRLSRSGKRLGLARDLDVLRQRLEESLLPDLESSELRLLKPVLKRLRRERREARTQLRRELHSSRHLRMIQALQHWLRKPRITALGAQPLSEWLVEWQWPWLGSLLLHPAWWIRDSRTGADERALHDLRKGIKGARYRLENLQPLAGASALAWLERLKEGQGLLGDLHDIAVLREAIDRRLTHGLPEELPGLEARLHQQREESWNRWRDLAAQLTAWPERRQLLQSLIGEPA